MEIALFKAFRVQRSNGYIKYLLQKIEEPRPKNSFELDLFAISQDLMFSGLTQKEIWKKHQVTQGFLHKIFMKIIEK